MGTASSCSRPKPEQTSPAGVGDQSAAGSIRAVQMDGGALFINGEQFLSRHGGPAVQTMSQGGAVYVPQIALRSTDKSGSETEDSTGRP